MKTNICRICLEDRALYPIFENVELNIHSKITTCLHATIEDVEGYPRQICNNCNETLDVLYNFINVFLESCKTLENKLLDIKIENDANSHYESDFDTAINIKEEAPDLNNLDDKKTSEITTRSKTRSIKNKRKIVVKKVLSTKKTKIKCDRDKRYAVASSILEGEFTWSGEEWCLKNNKAPKNYQNEQKAVQETKKTNIVKKRGIKERKPGPKLCDLCGAVFDKDSKLSAHKKRLHFNTPVKCPLCSRAVSSEYYLNMHMERRHRNNKNIQCNTCDARFAYNKDLKRHMNAVHMKKRKINQIFTCDMCDKTYKCIQSLTIHKRSIHTGERPEVCNVCGASFFHMVYLREHMRLHTGEKPFKCPICERGYSQQGNMKSHLRNHKISQLDAATMSKIKPILLKYMRP